MDIAAFDDGKWRLKLRSHVRAHRVTTLFLENKALYDAHLSTEKGSHLIGLDRDDLEQEGLLDDYMRQRWDDDEAWGPDHDMEGRVLQKTIEFETRSYRAQFVVICATLVEAMLWEAFRAVFSARPEVMHAFLVEEDAHVPQGYIKFSEVLETESRAALIERLSDRACANATKGKVERTIRRLSQLINASFNKAIVSNIQELFDVRNRIVHEARSELDLGVDFYDSLGPRVESTLDALTATLVAGHIPVRRK